MENKCHNSFPSEVVERLKTYVYRLIDPRNGETFYVGKGVANRVFAHIRAEAGLSDGEAENDKISRIREIRVAGFEVAHVIHRHGMDDATAFEVECALNDAYPGLTNIAGGVGGNEFGAMHANEIIDEYRAVPADLSRHRVLLISVNRTATMRSSLYEATRYAWKIDPVKASRAELILATVQGVIRGAFVADKWLEATAANFPPREGAPGRVGFIGHEAHGPVAQQYIGKRIPDEFRKKGAANPIKYGWKDGVDGGAKE